MIENSLLILPTGRFLSPNRDLQPLPLLREYDAVPPFVRLNVTTEDIEFDLWMSVGDEQEENTHARHAIDQLTTMHFACTGPVLLTGLPSYAVAELGRG